MTAPDPASKQYSVTIAGRHWFYELGIEVATLKPTAAGVARRCLDWTERRHHLAGPLGTALMARFAELAWIRRDRASRAVSITPTGSSELRRLLQIETLDLMDAPSGLFLQGRCEKALDSGDVSAVDETRTAWSS
ncbi:MAG: hypothetical protein JOZ27_07320 [Caulobacteraceae bacterium]|nr:hypothetical protein [Caulobacteraceae bacterium]